MNSLYKEDECISLSGFNGMETFITLNTSLSKPRKIYDISENIEDMTGYKASLFLEGKTDFFSLICVDDLIRFNNQYNETLKEASDQAGIDDFRIVNINNEMKYLKAYVKVSHDLVTILLFDVTEYYEQLKNNDDIIKRYKNLMITLNEAIWDWNVLSGSVYYSRRWSEMLGYKEEEIKGTLDEWKNSVHPEDLKAVIKTIEAHIKGDTDIYDCTYRLKKKDGSYLWISDRGIKQIDDHGDTVRMIGSHRDITFEKESRENLEKMIITDELTGMFNRRHYDSQLKEELLRAERYNSELSILMLDIDLFKQINDTYGHRAGDTALKKLAEVVKNKIRNTDSAYRTGGEEFIVIAPLTNKENAYKAAERLRLAVSEIVIDTKYGIFSFTISLGVSTFKKGDSYSSLNEKADIALYQSKDSGRNKTSVYS